MSAKNGDVDDRAAPIPAAEDAWPGPPGLDELHRMALEAYESIPAEMRRHCEGVVIRVAEWPEDEVLDEMGLESPYDLLGLYQGIEVGQKHAGHVAPLADMVFLYRSPLLAYCEDEGADLAREVRHTLIHEIGHHFGLSDEAMERIERAAEAAEEKRGR
jgi:predicted Zn-dependent protease with MMP-like domain